MCVRSPAWEAFLSSDICSRTHRPSRVRPNSSSSLLRGSKRRMRWPRRLRETETKLNREARCQAVLSALREILPGVRAFLFLGPDGKILDSSSVEPELDLPRLASELSTLLRIVEHTSVDTGL